MMIMMIAQCRGSRARICWVFASNGIRLELGTEMSDVAFLEIPCVCIFGATCGSSQRAEANVSSSFMG